MLIFPVRMISKNPPTLSLSLSSLNRRCSWAPCSSSIACSHFLANSSTSQFRARIFVSIWKLKFHVKLIKNVPFLIPHSKQSALYLLFVLKTWILTISANGKMMSTNLISHVHFQLNEQCQRVRWGVAARLGNSSFKWENCILNGELELFRETEWIGERTKTRRRSARSRRAAQLLNYKMLFFEGKKRWSYRSQTHPVIEICIHFTRHYW